MSPVGRRRILMLTDLLPFPPHWGAGMRNLQLLSHLAATDDITLLTFVGSDAEERDVAALRAIASDVHTIPLPRTVTTWKRPAQTLAMLTPLSYQHLMFRSAELQRLINRLSREQPFDLVQVEYSQMAQFDFGPGVPVVLDEHNIEYEVLLRVSQTERSVLRKLFNRVEYAKFKRAEIRTWRSVAGCIFTSDRERDIAAIKAPLTPCVVVPNGVDADHFLPAQTPPGSEGIVFTGMLNYRPNRDAAIYFARSILPLVQRERPNVTFSVVGKDPPPDVCELAGPAVEVTGSVPDVRPYLERAAVAVAPLRMGGGTRLKILEALAMAKPVVSTSIGAEGLSLQSGEHLLLADDPEQFAGHVVRLLSDADLARSLGVRGRNLVQEEYAWPVVAGQLRGFHTQVLERHRARGRTGRRDAVAARQ